MPTRRIVLLATLFVAIVCLVPLFLAPSNSAQAGQKSPEGEYRILEPLRSGSLTLFPVVRTDQADAAKKWDYITLDEGLRSGEVVVTEYGKLDRMVRPHGHARPIENYRGDRVNTLVLVNNSNRPLILLAGEIVTGGKQDRVIGKDRIVPAGSDPIDLSVFCIEHGRWTESSDKFGAAGKGTAGSFMVQPSVRTEAMVAQNQQQVWDSVHRSVETASKAAAPQHSSVDASPRPLELGTTSYAKVLGDQRVQKQVDSVAEPLTRSNREVLDKLRAEHAVGVVVAVHGEIIWADIFATPDMLAAYWTKLVRSYAAESFDEIGTGKSATVADVQRFLDRPVHGSESSEGETGVYRYREIRGNTQSTFLLQVLLPGTDFNAHISRVAEEGREANVRPIAIE
jgi:hypothetical protein